MKINIWVIALFSLLLSNSSFSLPDHRIQALVRDSNTLANNINNGNYSEVTRLTHSKIVNSVGGHEKLERMLNKLLYPMLESGKFKGMEFKRPKEIKNINGNLYSIVPYQAKLFIRKSIYFLDSFYLGVSDNKGQTWLFVDGNGLHPAGAIEWLIPDYDGELSLPSKKKPYLKKSFNTL